MNYLSTNIKLRATGRKLTEGSGKIIIRLSINTAYKYTKVSSLHERYLTEMVQKCIQEASAT